MTAAAADINKLELKINTEGLSESDIQKMQKLGKAIGTDQEFLAAEDVYSACKAVAKHVGQTYEAVLAKYEELKESLTEQLKRILMGERELTDAELDAVDGGGFWGEIGNWFKENWKLVAGVTAVSLGVVLTGGGLIGVGLAASAGTAVAGWASVATGVLCMIGGKSLTLDWDNHKNN